MRSAEEPHHILNASCTVNVPLDYFDIGAILEALPEDSQYDNLREHLEDHKSEAL